MTATASPPPDFLLLPPLPCPVACACAEKVSFEQWPNPPLVHVRKAYCEFHAAVDAGPAAADHHSHLPLHATRHPDPCSRCPWHIGPLPSLLHGLLRMRKTPRHHKGTDSMQWLRGCTLKPEGKLRERVRGVLGIRLAWHLAPNECTVRVVQQASAVMVHVAEHPSMLEGIVFQRRVVDYVVRLSLPDCNKSCTNKGGVLMITTTDMQPQQNDANGRAGLRVGGLCWCSLCRVQQERCMEKAISNSRMMAERATANTRRSGVPRTATWAGMPSMALPALHLVVGPPSGGLGGWQGRTGESTDGRPRSCQAVHPLGCGGNAAGCGRSMLGKARGLGRTGGELALVVLIHPVWSGKLQAAPLCATCPAAPTHAKLVPALWRHVLLLSAALKLPVRSCARSLPSSRGFGEREGQQRRKEKMVLTEGHHPPLNQLVQLFDSSRGCPDHPWALHTAARPRPKARREGAAAKSGACGLVLTHGLRASGVSIRALSGKCFAARPRACSVSRHPRVSACSLAETDCSWCKRCECGGVLITLRTSVPCAVQSHCVCPSFPRVCAPFAPLIIRILY